MRTLQIAWLTPTPEYQNKAGANHQAPASCLVPAALQISSNVFQCELNTMMLPRARYSHAAAHG